MHHEHCANSKIRCDENTCCRRWTKPGAHDAKAFVIKTCGAYDGVLSMTNQPLKVVHHHTRMSELHNDISSRHRLNGVVTINCGNKFKVGGSRDGLAHGGAHTPKCANDSNLDHGSESKGSVWLKGADDCGGSWASEQVTRGLGDIVGSHCIDLGQDLVGT